MDKTRFSHGLLSFYLLQTRSWNVEVKNCCGRYIFSFKNGIFPQTSSVWTVKIILFCLYFFLVNQSLGWGLGAIYSGQSYLLLCQWGGMGTAGCETSHPVWCVHTRSCPGNTHSPLVWKVFVLWILTLAVPWKKISGQNSLQPARKKNSVHQCHLSTS